MKKFFSFAVGAMMLFQFSTASADMTAEPIFVQAPNTMEPAITSLLSFDRWLFSNNFAGINYINDNFAQAYIKAIAWEHSAHLFDVEVNYNPRDGVSCDFLFGSTKKTTTYFDVPCVDLAKLQIQGGEKAFSGQAVTEDKFYDLPEKKLRKFVFDIQTTPDVMLAIRDKFQGQSDTGLQFSLGVLQGSLTWTMKLHQKDAPGIFQDIVSDAGSIHSAVVVAD